MWGDPQLMPHTGFYQIMGKQIFWRSPPLWGVTIFHAHLRPITWGPYNPRNTGFKALRRAKNVIFRGLQTYFPTSPYVFSHHGRPWAESYKDAMHSWDHETKKVKFYQTFWPKIPRAENYRTVAALRYVGYRFWFWRNFDGLCGATKQSGTPRGSEPRWTSSRGGEPEAAASLLTGKLALFS